MMVISSDTQCESDSSSMAAANKEGSHLVSNFSIRALLSVREPDTSERNLE
mgnify:FL=1